MTPLPDQEPIASAPAPASAAAPVAGGTLDEDVPCSACGYNLRGLSPGGNCPECGGPISKSMHQWALWGRMVGGDPRWVRKLGRAMDLALLSVAAALAAPPLMIVGVLALRRTGPRVPGTSAPILALLWAAGVWLAPLALGLAASWWFTTAPPVNGPALRRGPAVLARTAALAFALAIVTLGILILADGVLDAGLPDHIYPSLILIILFICTAGVFAAGTYAAELAGYLEDSTLSLNTNVMTWIDGILGLVALAVGVMSLMDRPRAPGRGLVDSFVPPVACVLACGLPIAGMLTLALMIWFRVRLTRIIRRGLLGPWRGTSND